MSILLVRHGESTANIDHTEYRSKPDHAIQLTPRGVTQAAEAGAFISEWYKNNPPKGKVRLWSSPYLRATQTAIGIRENTPGIEWDGGGLDHDIHFDARLREREWGPDFAQAYHDDGEMLETDPEYYHHYRRTRHTRQGRYFVKPRHGESIADVALRLYSFIHDLHFDISRGITEHIVVAHGVTILAFLQAMTKLHPGFIDEEPLGDNTAIRLLDEDAKGRIVNYGFIYEPLENIYLLNKPDKPVVYDLKNLLTGVTADQ
jgi:broad specificity phosphatase PhoE